jgi:mRNA interferase RelE/StbE
MFKVVIHKKVIREIKNLKEDDVKRILSAIKEMEKEPFVGDVKPIKGLKGVFRKRIGDYRIAFTVNFDQMEVIILKVGRRKRFYKEL